MSDAPETIWVNINDSEDGCCPVEDEHFGDGRFYDPDTATEYRRADLPPTLSAALKLPKVKALKDALYECQTALSDFGKAYPHMVKGYMLDAENNAIAALRAIAGGGHE